MTARREPKLDTILRAQMWLHRVAKRMRIPIAVRRGMVDVVDQIFREIYARRRRSRKKR